MFSVILNQYSVLVIAKVGLEFALRINSSYWQIMFGSITPLSPFFD